MIDLDLDRGNGRTVSVRTAGADSGPLVIFLHGSPSSRLDIDDLHARSRARGLRVAAFDRPGYGRSSFVPFTFDSVAADACAVADNLGAGTFSIFGFSAGGPHALAVAALRPDRVSALATGGSGGTYAPEYPWWESLSEEEKKGVSLIGTDDVEAERLLAEADRPYMEALDRDDVALQAFWRDHFGPADQRCMDQGIGPLMVASIREALRQGQAGWARDNVVRMGRWPFDLPDVRCPTDIWYGEEDEWRPGEWIVDQVPHARLHVLPDRGHLVHYEEWDQVLDHLT